jgi:hypothetical protein
MGKPRARWENVVRRDPSQILGIRGWRRRTEDKEEWRRLLREAMAQKGLQRHGWLEMPLYYSSELELNLTLTVYNENC